MKRPLAQEVVQIDIGSSPVPTYALMLRFHHRDVVPTGTPPGPAQATRDLYLTERQARDLLLLLGRQLGFPGTGIEVTPPPPPH